MNARQQSCETASARPPTSVWPSHQAGAQQALERAHQAAFVARQVQRHRVAAVVDVLVVGVEEHRRRQGRLAVPRAEQGAPARPGRRRRRRNWTCRNRCRWRGRAWPINSRRSAGNRITSRMLGSRSAASSAGRCRCRSRRSAACRIERAHEVVVEEHRLVVAGILGATWPLKRAAWSSASLSSREAVAELTAGDVELEALGDSGPLVVGARQRRDLGRVLHDEGGLPELLFHRDIRRWRARRRAPRWPTSSSHATSHGVRRRFRPSWSNTERTRQHTSTPRVTAASGDDEAMFFDHDFVRTANTGMPPTGTAHGHRPADDAADRLTKQSTTK